jgi:hypothetical protein
VSKWCDNVFRKDWKKNCDREKCFEFEIELMMSCEAWGNYAIVFLCFPASAQATKNSKITHIMINCVSWLKSCTKTFRNSCLKHFYVCEIFLHSL